MLILKSAPVRAVAAMFILNGAFFGAWAARVPSIKSNFALSPDSLGLLLLLLAGGAIVSFPAAGAVVNRLGAAVTTKMVAVVYAIALALIGLSPSIEMLAFSLFLFGFTHGAMDVAMNAWGAEVEQHIKRPVLSFFHAMFSLGAGVGALFGALAIENDLAVLPHLLGFAVIATLPCMMMVMIKWQSHISETASGGRLFIFPQGPLVLVGIIAFCAAMGEGAMADWSAVYIVETLAADERTAAIGYAVFSATMVITRLLGGYIITTIGAYRTAQISGAVAFAGISLAIVGADVLIVMTGYALMGCGFALIMPIAFSRAANDKKQSAGTAIASVATLGYGGMLLGPPVIGFVAENSSFQTSFAVLALLTLIIVFLSKVLKRSD